MRDGKYLILCVDDDEDLLDSLVMTLEANGYDVVRASSGEEGLKAYKENNPDLVISDLMMEEMDSGITLVKELKLLGCSVPIYMLSSVGDQFDLVSDHGDLGLSGVFQKPLSIATLISTLQNKLR